jgi:hypothetical protein
MALFGADGGTGMDSFTNAREMPLCLAPRKPGKCLSLKTVLMFCFFKTLDKKLSAFPEWPHRLSSSLL